jgi:hypothetical protein
VLVAGSDLISYTSGLCLDSYGELALQQEQISVRAPAYMNSLLCPHACCRRGVVHLNTSVFH